MRERKRKKRKREGVKEGIEELKDIETEMKETVF